MAKGQGKKGSAAERLIGADATKDDGLDPLAIPDSGGAGSTGDVPDTGLDDADPWKAPFYLRFRLYTLGGLILSAAWVWGVHNYVEAVLGWNNVTELLPHEVGGLAAGALTPLALLWMVIAFWERGQSLRRDTEALRWHMRQLIYPSDKAETRVRSRAWRRNGAKPSPA